MSFSQQRPSKKRLLEDNSCADDATNFCDGISLAHHERVNADGEDRQDSEPYLTTTATTRAVGNASVCVCQMRVETLQVELENERSMRLLDQKLAQQVQERLEQWKEIADLQAKHATKALEDFREKSQMTISQLRQSRDQALQELERLQDRCRRGSGCESFENDGNGNGDGGEMLRRNFDCREKNQDANMSDQRLSQIKFESEKLSKELEIAVAENQSWKAFCKALNDVLDGVDGISKWSSMAQGCHNDDVRPPDLSKVVKFLNDTRQRVADAECQKIYCGVECKELRQSILAFEGKLTAFESKEGQLSSEREGMEGRLDLVNRKVSLIESQQTSLRRENDSLRDIIKGYGEAAPSSHKASNVGAAGKSPSTTKADVSAKALKISLASVQKECKLIKDEFDRLSKDLGAMSKAKFDLRKELERAKEKSCNLRDALGKKHTMGTLEGENFNENEAVSTRVSLNPNTSTLSQEAPRTESLKKEVAELRDELEALIKRKKQFHLYGGKWHRVPEYWRFPRCSVEECWRQWWIGDPLRRIPPLRFLKIEDIRHLDSIPVSTEEMPGRTGPYRGQRRSSKRSLSDLRYLMNYIQKRVMEAGKFTNTITLETVTDMYSVVADEFRKAKRNEGKFWSSAVNDLRKRYVRFEECEVLF